MLCRMPCKIYGAYLVPYIACLYTTQQHTNQEKKHAMRLSGMCRHDDEVAKTKIV